MSPLLLFKKSNVRALLVIRANRSQKWAIHLKKFVFFVCYCKFSPFFMPKTESLMSLFTHSLCFKEQFERFAPVALLKEHPEQFAQVIYNKRASLSDLLTLLFKKDRKFDLLKKTSESHFQSFAHKKQAIRWKNLWANSQPLVYSLYSIQSDIFFTLNFESHQNWNILYKGDFLVYQTLLSRTGSSIVL